MLSNPGSVLWLAMVLITVAPLTSAEAGKKFSSGGAGKTWAISSVQISPSQAQILQGTSLPLSAKAYDRRGKNVGDCSFTFSTSDSTIASVSATGMVQGVSVGSASVSATCNGVSGSSQITVVATAAPSPTPTLTPTPSPTLSPSPTPTIAPSPTPTVTPSPTPSPTPTPSPAPTGTPQHPDLKGTAALDVEEIIFVTLINQYRADNGLGPLKVSVDLTIAADWMSDDMATKNYFSHTDSLGRSPFQRMTDFGYTYSTSKGENLAAGNSTAQNTFTQWKNSPGHNANMLTASYKVMGIARVYGANSTYRWYWTNKFGGYVDETVPGL